MRRRLILVAGLLLIAMPFASARPGLPNEIRSTDLETRCGWFSNPTPANIWLYDRDAEWTIGEQGGYQVPGDWPWPTFKPRQWVVTNAGDHGMDVRACDFESTNALTKCWKSRALGPDH